jgi:DNA-binding transcriptional LysR family regulator
MFLRIGELGSLSKAAHRMRVAQPALSRQMKLLQEDIGVLLFMRHRHGMRLTRAGEELMRRVAGPIRQLDQAVEDVHSAEGRPAGLSAFGIVPTVSSLLAARLAARVAADFPGISLRIVEGYDGHLIDWLQRGEIDAAIVYASEAGLQIEAEELVSEDLVVVGPRGSELDGKRPMSMAEFAQLPLVLPSRPHGLRAVVETASATAKAKLCVRFEADSFRVLKELVERGLGYTALPLSSIHDEQREGRLIYAPLIEPKVARRLMMALPADSTVSRATRTVVNLAREEIAALVRSGAWRARLRFTPSATNPARSSGQRGAHSARRN